MLHVLRMKLVAGTVVSISAKCPAVSALLTLVVSVIPHTVLVRPIAGERTNVVAVLPVCRAIDLPTAADTGCVVSHAVL